jgi:parvulin-like peptidyl-prolyl isomerase
LVVGLTFHLCLVLTGLFLGAEEKDAATSPAGDAVVASVGEEPIYAREVYRLQKKAARGKRLSPSSLQLLQAQLLEEVVSRRLVLAYAKHNNEAASEKEIDQALADLKRQLSTQRKTLADYLKELSVSEDELRRQLSWNVLWEKYLKKYTTKERIQKYFEAHRREFDGTEISVSHILLMSSSDEKENGKDDLTARANSLREDILTGKISFAEAVQKYSTGPSRNDSGKLGFIGRHGPMDNTFSRAAFKLQPGEISPPVRNVFGVHLIRCDEIRPGKKQLADVEPAIRDALARELMEKLAAAQRAQTIVKYVKNFPHLDPGSHTLVKP